MPDPTPVRSHADASVTGLLGEIASVGTDPGRGGYTRPVYSAAETDLRAWFIEHATRRSLQVGATRKHCAASACSSNSTSNKDAGWSTWDSRSPSAPRSSATADGG